MDGNRASCFWKHSCRKTPGVFARHRRRMGSTADFLSQLFENALILRREMQPTVAIRASS